MRVFLSDLVAVSEAAKALKAKTILWFNNIVASIDVADKLALIYLEPSNLQNFPHRALQIETRELSTFLKSVVLSEFDIPDTALMPTFVTLDSGTSAIINVGLGSQIDLHMRHLMDDAHRLEEIGYPNERDVTEDFIDLYSMKKDSGAGLFSFNSTHSMFLFSGILPLNKGDRLYAGYFDLGPRAFNVRFRVVKKSKLTILVYLNFINIINTVQ